MVDKIVTAEELLDYILACGGLTLKPIAREVAIAAIKQKCAFEVQAALKAASEKAEMDSIIHGWQSGQKEINKLSILNAYPLENIK